MQQVLKVAGRLAPAAAGAAAVASSAAGPSHAHVRPSAVATAEGPISPLSIKDEWEMADISKDRVIFKPADIDEAANFLTRGCNRLSISDDEAWTSDGEAADSIIELDCEAEQRAASQEQWSAAVAVAARLLKSPAVQQEMLQAALTDPEVFAILCQKKDAVKYLRDAGFAAAGLLPAPDSNTAAAEGGAPEEYVLQGEEPGEVLASWVDSLVKSLEALGDSIAQLGRWIRSRLMKSQEPAPATAENGAAAECGADAGMFWGSGVLITAFLAIFAIALLRK